MLVINSKHRTPKTTNGTIAKLLRSISVDRLFAYVDMLSFPRHYLAERRANERARTLLINLLRSFGYSPIVQGSFDNIIVTTPGPARGPYLLLGAHYDSVPDTPGADDNASAVAVCLECARLLLEAQIGSTMIAFFNREEDGLLGSREFVSELKTQGKWLIGEAHIFEMVGYCDRMRCSQRVPPGLPRFIAPNVGDFLALLANRNSNPIAEKLISLAASYVPHFPVLALKMYFGIERLFGHFQRSDHAPFWEAGIPSLMWTDTSNFRNPHYHLPSDTPDTLDYDFMHRVTKLALARVATRLHSMSIDL